MRALTLLVLLPLLVPATAAAETQITVGNVRVRATSEIGSDSPKALSQTLQAALKKQGWRDIIYTTEGADESYLFYTQHTLTGGKITEVTVTFWKAIKDQGQTRTCTWVASLSPADVNRFLDEDFARVAMQFKLAKG